MHSDPAGALADIERHIDLATGFLSGVEYDAFVDDARTLYAIVRCLEIVSEASRRLPEELKARHPAIPWKDIAGAGNIYRHDYEDVAAKIVWDTVVLGLPPLRAAIEEEIERLCTPTDESRPAS